MTCWSNHDERIHDSMTDHTLNWDEQRLGHDIRDHFLREGYTRAQAIERSVELYMRLINKRKAEGIKVYDEQPSPEYEYEEKNYKPLYNYLLELEKQDVLAREAAKEALRDNDAWATAQTSSYHGPADYDFKEGGPEIASAPTVAPPKAMTVTG